MNRNYKSWKIAQEGSHCGALNSSVIKRIAYCEEDRILRVTFLSGKVYDYSDVPDFRFDSMVGYYSVGEYYNFYIKGSYESNYLGFDDALDSFEIVDSVTSDQRKTYPASQFRFTVDGFEVERIAQVGAGRYLIGEGDGNNLDGIELPWRLSQEISIEDIQKELESHDLCGSKSQIVSWWIVTEEDANATPEDAKSFIR